MQTLTVAMIVYCLAFAALLVGISIYRRMKRNREMSALEGSRASGSTLAEALLGKRSALSQSSVHSDSPHDTPSAKHAA